MFSIVVCLLGICLGASLRWFALPVVATVLAVALGIEGALSARPFASVALSATAMLIGLELAYLAGAVAREVAGAHRYRGT